MCKTCSKQKFFSHKVNTNNNLYQVEKKFFKIVLICFVTV